MKFLNYRLLTNKPYFLFLIIGLSGIFFMYLFLDRLMTFRLIGIRILFDSYDLNVYYNSSSWVTGQGRLYKEVASEYPLFANLIFGSIRFLADNLHPFPTSKLSFIWIWMSIAWCLYLWLIYQINSKFPKLTLWIFLTPTFLYFSLVRFDIYPVVFTFVALQFIQKQKYYQGALALGIAIALKGYALFLIPSFWFYCYYRKGFYLSLKIIAICILPIIIGNFAVLSYAGLEGATSSYGVHIRRGLNKQSTYDAFKYLLHLDFMNYVSDFPWITHLLQLLCAFIAAALRPKTFEDLVNSLLLSIVGFISFSAFYSPQFALWIASIACFSNSRLILRLTIAYNWITYFYFPIAFDKRQYSLSLPSHKLHIGLWLFQSIIVVNTIIRFIIMYLNIKKLIKKDQTLIT